MIASIRARLADRNSLPRWLNAVIDGIADRPMSPAGRLAARRLGRPPSPSTTEALALPDTPLRVAIAPVNFSGQGREWSRALESADPAVGARNMAVEVVGGFQFASDLVVPTSVYHNDGEWQRRELAAVAERATHVLIEAEEPPFGRLLGRSTERQARALIDAGVDVAFVCHGTDIRLPSRHLKTTPWSHYSDRAVYVPRYETVARANRRLLDSLARPVFVSTPDLLLDVPYASWLPVVVEPARWAVDRQPRSGGPLRVVHAPSIAAHKGTALIEPALHRLHAEGVIEYRRVTGVPSARMPEEYRRADVLVDQFRVGSYGVAACEALAAGCAVVGHVTDQVRAAVSAASGLELPIVEADPDTLEAGLRRLAESDLTQLAARGRAFIDTVHDGRMSAAVLLERWIRKADSA